MKFLLNIDNFFSFGIEKARVFFLERERDPHRKLSFHSFPFKCKKRGVPEFV